MRGCVLAMCMLRLVTTVSIAQVNKSHTLDLFAADSFPLPLTAFSASLIVPLFQFFHFSSLAQAIDLLRVSAVVHQALTSTVRLITKRSFTIYPSHIFTYNVVCSDKSSYPWDHVFRHPVAWRLRSLTGIDTGRQKSS